MTEKYSFVGDVHGKYNTYYATIEMLNNADKVYQVGDMGMGFDTLFDNFYKENIENDFPNIKFIRGNHDDPAVCKSMRSFIGDGTVETTKSGKKIMFLGGASSIDRTWGNRVQGKSWWKDEQLTQEELDILVDKYIDIKPDVMVTHTFPSKICETLFGVGTERMPWLSDAALGNPDGSGQGCIPGIEPRTEIALQLMWNAHKPSVWIGGHWHLNRDTIINDTRFICLDELNTITISI